ncbi:hypothetical protein PENTCL1PPCAC_24725, partial [Pristionchus entomophagus]
MCKDPQYRGIRLTNNRWLINNKFYYNGSTRCRNSLEKPNSAKWFVTNEEGKDVELAQAGGTADMHCNIATSYTNKCLSKAQCGDLWKLDGIRCPVEHKMRYTVCVRLDLEIEKLECELAIGRFVVDDNRTVVIEKGANIYCE